MVVPPPEAAAAGSPISKLAESSDTETLRSAAEGLAKIAHKGAPAQAAGWNPGSGWQSEIDAHRGVTICLSLLKQPEPRVYTKALALLHPLAASPLCRPGLIAGGAVEVRFGRPVLSRGQFAWAYAADSSASKRDSTSRECWEQALAALCHFAIGGEPESRAAVVNCGGIPAMADNLGSGLTELCLGPGLLPLTGRRCSAGLERLSREREYHQLILGTAALTKMVGLLQGDSVAHPTALGTLCSVAACLANLAENVECHPQFEAPPALARLNRRQICAVTEALLAVVTEERALLRREVARALANLCRVLQLQRNILIHKYLWNTFAVLGLSTDPADKQVAVNFYLYVSENECLSEIVQHVAIPVTEHLVQPLVALGYAPDLAERVALALGNLAPAIRKPMAEEEACIELMVSWLEPGTPAVCTSEAVRVLTSLCYQSDPCCASCLNLAIAAGALPLLTMLALQNGNVVLKCEVAKLLALCCRLHECHPGAIASGILPHLLELACSDDYVVKAEAVNSLGDLYNNCQSHPQLIAVRGLFWAINLAESDEALLANRGEQMLSSLLGSHPAHIPLIQSGCLLVLQQLAETAGPEIKAVIAEGFGSIATDESCCEAMCADEHVKVLEGLASQREHMLSSAALRVLISMAERFHAQGVSGEATAALARLATDPLCRDEMIENDGYARLAGLTGCQDEKICREASRILSQFMDHAAQVQSLD